MLNKTAFVTGWLAAILFSGMVWALVGKALDMLTIQPLPFLISFATFCALLICSFLCSSLSSDKDIDFDQV